MGDENEILDVDVQDLSDEGLGQLSELLLNTREQCQMMENLIQNQIEVKDGLINRLHDELDYYKQDSAERFTEQLMKAIIKAYNSMKKMISSDKFANMNADELREEYEYAVDDIKDLLEMQNVDEFIASEGDDFDGSRQQAIKTEITNNSALDKKIKNSLSAGFTRNGKVIVTERVVVYQYKE